MPYKNPDWKKIYEERKNRGYFSSEKHRARKNELHAIRMDTDPKYRARHNEHSYNSRTKATKEHGLSKSSADALIASQGNRCFICRKEPWGSGSTARLHIDHCHESRLVRAALCVSCNSYLGFVNDDVGLMKLVSECRYDEFRNKVTSLGKTSHSVDIFIGFAIKYPEVIANMVSYLSIEWALIE